MKDPAFEKLKQASTGITCNECNKNFKPSSPYQIYCSEQCENVKKEILQKKRESIFVRKCIECGLTFRRVDERSYQRICETCRRSESKKLAKENFAKLPKKEKVKNPKKKISYDELIRRSEYNRVYGKGAWDHYTKGHKWDRI